SQISLQISKHTNFSFSCSIIITTMASRILYAAAVVAAVAVSSLAGVAYAADAPAPSPTSGAAAVSSSLVAAVLCPAVALLLGNLRQ
ncbi:Os05g0541750, partial [Oryza sativa Japonica Group]